MLKPIYPQYSRVLDSCLALRYLFFEVLCSKSVKKVLVKSFGGPWAWASGTICAILVDWFSPLHWLL